MQFKVRDWMVDLIVFVDPDSTVSEALALMRRRYIHSLIVQITNNNPSFGILTSTDISDKVIAENRNPSTIKVRELMTSPLITVKTDDPIQECAKIMRQKKIHHLPVMDNKGALVGMISATDFLVAAEAMGREPGEKIS
ncbi:MAG: CBS domain-containing protein [Leptolinea sp.]|jgi:CBS domain-containing protein|nr:CBS domain-containing protein [Leptolinea sp.]